MRFYSLLEICLNFRKLPNLFHGNDQDINCYIKFFVGFKLDLSLKGCNRMGNSEPLTDKFMGRGTGYML